MTPSLIITWLITLVCYWLVCDGFRCPRCLSSPSRLNAVNDCKFNHLATDFILAVPATAFVHDVQQILSRHDFRKSPCGILSREAFLRAASGSVFTIMTDFLAEHNLMIFVNDPFKKSAWERGKLFLRQVKNSRFIPNSFGGDNLVACRVDGTMIRIPLSPPV
jgi:hypothetical protein